MNERKKKHFWPYYSYRLGWGILSIGFAGSMFGYFRLFAEHPMLGAIAQFSGIMLGMIGLVMAWAGVIFAHTIESDET
jgi:hypothetical protein